ncbi:MAG: glycosyltransferase [Clostridiales bacterium]|nr:glycosyltransferase [Clostridiales bacterium]
MNKPKVNVVLATYNGEKFLTRQLDSVVNQTYENIDIYIRDDGSVDGTVAFIEEYIRQDQSGRKFVFWHGEGENLRCPSSFYEILRRCETADYYAFCDQDDEWYPEKFGWAVERLEQEKQDEILLYYTACDYYTDQGVLIRRSPQQKEHLELTDVLYYTPGSGFTMVFNETARRRLLQEVNPGQELHDRWMIRGAVCFGKVIYDGRSSAAHIRHEAAVTAGDAGAGSLIRNFVREELMGDEAKQEKEFLRYFREAFGGSLTSEQKRVLDLFAAEGCSVVRWFRKVFYPWRLRTRTAGEIALRFLFVFGKI